MQPYKEPEGERKTVAEYHIYLNQILGRGGFGTVYEGYNTKTHQVVAVKMIQRTTNSGVQSAREHQKIISLKRQATILNKVYSQYVVGFRDIIATKRYYYIIQEKCDTSLAQFLKQLKSKNEYLNEKEAVQLMGQILKGFYALIVLNITHRDVKPDNFLMKNKKIKIADFGLSRRINEKQMMQSVVGTLGYQSPEVFHGEPYTSKCDVYSAGCVFYEILYLRRAFSVYTGQKIKDRMLEIDNLQFPIEPVYSEKLKDLIKSCLKYKEEHRAGWVEVFNHEVFSDCGLPSLSKLNMALSYILSVIRKEIEAKSLNIQKYLEKIGISKNKEIGIQDYTKILIQLTPIDKRLNLEQIRYSFNYFDKDKSGTISYKQFVQVLESHGIIMNSNEAKYNVEEIHKILFSQNTSRTEKGGFNIDQIKKDEKSKAHKKLLQQLVQKNLEDVIQNFELEDLSSEGITIDVFIEFIKNKLELDFTNQECESLFEMFDENKDGRVQYQQFYSNIVQKFKTSKTNSSVE